MVQHARSHKKNVSSSEAPSYLVGGPATRAGDVLRSNSSTKSRISADPLFLAIRILFNQNSVACSWLVKQARRLQDPWIANNLEEKGAFDNWALDESRVRRAGECGRISKIAEQKY